MHWNSARGGNCHRKITNMLGLNGYVGKWPGLDTPILEGDRELPHDWPPIWHFPVPLGPFLYLTRSYWPPLSQEKISLSLSLSHLVREILWPKVGLLFLPNLSFDHFEAGCTIFLIVDLVDPFFIVLRSVWPLIFTKS